MKLFIVLAALCSLAVAAKLPQTFSRCKVSPGLDNKPNECLRKAVQESIRQLSDKGSQDLGASDLDPLKINKILIEKGETSPIAIKLEYTDNDLVGLSNVVVKEVSGKLSSAKDFEMTLEAFLDEINLKGPYSVNGKVLILPIQGVGQSHMRLVNLTSKILIKGEPQIKNGKEYLKITTFKLEMAHIDRMDTNLSNLFNGDKALGDNMNKFLNENWKEIYGELKPSVEGAFAAIFEVYTKRIMERVQFKNIFLVE